MVFSRLDSGQLDALMEISNIGVGHAATAFSQLLGTSVHIQVPQVAVVDISDVPDELGGAERSVVGLFLKILGDASGNILLIFPTESAHKMVSLLLNQDPDECDMDSELAVSALKEVGNILASAYLSALGSMLSLSLIPSTPNIACDMAGAIVDQTLIELCSKEDKALVVETEFFIRDNELKGNFFLMPDPETLNIILEAVGMGTE